MLGIIRGNKEVRMTDSTADVVICGAGISGISAAYHLAVKRGVKNVILVDEREPMSFTSDKSKPRLFSAPAIVAKPETWINSRRSKSIKTSLR